MIFLIDLNGIMEDMNLNRVIEIQNIELKVRDYSLVDTFLSTANDEIQLENPS
jgi:hypothetical protein